MAEYNVELRERIDGQFTDIIRIASDVSIVNGLLDSGGKINLSLFPSSLLTSKKNAGPLLGTKTLADIYTLMETFNDSKTDLYPGTFFIANGKVLINPSTDHYILYGDDGAGVTQVAFELDHGDHLFYVKYGSEYLWNDLSTIITPPSSFPGVANLPSPYNAILGSHIFATFEELSNLLPSTNGLYALMTGYRWVQTTSGDYDSAGGKIQKSATIGGGVTAADANYLCIPSFDLWDYSMQDAVLRIEDIGLGYSYWRLEQVIQDHGTNPAAYQSVAVNNKHFWGVINNDYPLATEDTAGLMSALDKYKLNHFVSNVSHTGDVVGSTSLTIQNGVVTFAKMQDVNSYTIAGRIDANTGDMKALTPTEVRTIINVEDNANNYSHPNHTGDVTSDGDGATTIANDVVTFAKMQNIDTARLLGRVSASAGNVESLTKAQVLTFINVEDGANKTLFASNTEMKAGTDTTKAMNPLETKNAIAFFGGLKRYGLYSVDAAVANAAHPDGAIVMFAV